jgi:hypothetical protein
MQHPILEEIHSINFQIYCIFQVMIVKQIVLCLF